MAFFVVTISSSFSLPLASPFASFPSAPALESAFALESALALESAFALESLFSCTAEAFVVTGVE